MTVNVKTIDPFRGCPLILCNDENLSEAAERNEGLYDAYVKRLTLFQASCWRMILKQEWRLSNATRCGAACGVFAR